MISPHPPLMQRAAGSVRIVANTAGLAELAHSGCLRACFPRRHTGPLEAVILNTAGGIADGDQLHITVSTHQAANLLVTTPSAERIYRARPGAAPARMDIALSLAPHSALHFIPQETILFEASALTRTTRINMPSSARYLGIDALVFGRQACGETLSEIQLRDTIQLRRDGTLVFQDSIRLDSCAQLAALAAAGQARAFACIVYAARQAESRLTELRAALHGEDLNAGASAWNGLLVARILANNAQALRRCVVAALQVLRPDQPLPRVWQS